MLAEKILFVDDDENVLIGYRRQLRKKADIYTALSAQQGLNVIEQEGPFAIVVSDMRMPNMNGAEFLTQVKEIEPDAIRIILTGQADIESAVDAINSGQIFRFLTKPCPPSVMAEALLNGIKQYRLLASERELLEKTLTGSINVLTELLSLSNPMAFGQATRLKHLVTHLLTSLGVGSSWDIEMASMLSGIGYITLSDEILSKLAVGGELSGDEKEQVEKSSGVSVQLLNNIPRLDAVIEIIESQNEMYRLEKPVVMLDEQERVRLGGHLLKAAKHVDSQLEKGISVDIIVDEMKRQGNHFDPLVAECFRTISLNKSTTSQLINVSQLSAGMIIEEDVLHNNGMLLLSKGHEVTEAVKLRLAQYCENDTVRQPFRVTTKNRCDVP
jgi:FixJ family two-component response regulator